jgi:hypothetical protein
MTTYQVTDYNDKIELVEADYVMWPLGMLVFKKRKPNPNTYPEVVKIYAPETWAKVEPLVYPESE